MILFMSGINLVVSAFDAALPGLIIPNPKNRMKVVYISMLILWKDTRIAQTLPFCLDMEKDRVQPLPCLF